MVEAINILENLLVMLKAGFSDKSQVLSQKHWNQQAHIVTKFYRFYHDQLETEKVLAEAQYCTGVSPTEDTPTVEAVSPVEFCEEVELHMGKSLSEIYSL